MGMREKRAEFLRDCLDKMEEFLGGNLALRALYDNCLIKLSEKDTISVSEIRECDTEKPEEKRSDNNKTYIARMHRLKENIEENKQYLKTDLGKFGLTKFPILKYNKGGGYGKESTFTLDIDDTPESNLNDSSQENEDPVRVEPKFSDGVIYKTKQISRPPWYLKAANPLFKKQKTRAISALTGLAAVFVLLPLSIAYILVFIPEVPYTAPVLVALLVSEYLLMGPALGVFHLVTRKITMVETFKHPLSTVCISELKGDGAKDLLSAERKLSVVTVSADCPICKSQYQIEGTVRLEQKRLARSIILGVCANNPMMHQFTFDKDLMAGERLKISA